MQCIVEFPLNNASKIIDIKCWINRRKQVDQQQFGRGETGHGLKSVISQTCTMHMILNINYATIIE